jgi:hypothetical protein
MEVSMNNAWIVVPVISNGTDLTSLVNNLSGGYIAPDTYAKEVNDPESGDLVLENIAHPYAGQTGPDFSNRIIFVNKNPGYATHSGVINLEDFDDISIYRYWNSGIDYAKANGADAIFLLNNPMDLDTFVLKDAYDLMISSNKEVVNVSDGAIILLSASSDLKPDAQFQIWFGDIDLYRRAENVSTKVLCEYIFTNYLIDHIYDNEFNSIVASDEAKYNTKWS